MKALALAMMFCGTCFGADLNVALISGGHDFEEAPFFEMFKSMNGIKVAPITFKNESPLFENIANWPYDVIVMYNMTQQISDTGKENLKALLNNGVGLVVLHHAIANYNDWPEYWKIIGARYFLKDTEENGKKYVRSQYAHDIDLTVDIADIDHPVVAGVKNFPVNDETYKGYVLEPDNHLLLTTSHEKSQKEIGWTRTYGKSRVCYIQPGHGAGTYNNYNYRKLVIQAVKWVSGK